MSEKAFKDNLLRSIKTGYPLIFIFTLEEERAKSILKEVSLDLLLDFFQISHFDFQPFHLGNLIDSVKDHSLILFDAIQFSIHERSTIRALLDSSIEFSNKGNTIVFISPLIDIPHELERFSSILYLPLPDDNLLQKQCVQVETEFSICISNDNRNHLVHLLRGLTLTSVRLILKKTLFDFSNDYNFLFSSIIQEKESILRRSHLLESVDTSFSLSDVGGMDRLKDWLLSRKSAFSDEARLFGLPCPRGLLLMGVQGCGKSLMAKAVAHFWCLPLVRLDFAALFGSDHPEYQLKEALLVVEAMFQAVLWIDEIEKAFDYSSGGIGNRLLGEFITWLQEKKHSIFVVATANRVENLPPELVRKGRFDEIFFVDLPNVFERYEIFSIHLRKYGRNPDLFNLEDLSKRTEGFSGSEIEQIVISGLFYAFVSQRDLLHDDLIRACKDTVSLLDMYEEEIKSLREWSSKRARFASTDRKKLDLFSK